MALDVRRSFFEVETGIDRSQIGAVSRLVSRLHRLRRPAEQGDRRARMRSRTRPASTRTGC